MHVLTCLDAVSVEGSRRFIREPASHVEAVAGSEVTLECVVGTDAGGHRPGGVPSLSWRRRSGLPLPHERHYKQLGMYCSA